MEASWRNSPKNFLSLKKRAAQIKVLLMDVDGTMTDRGVTLLSQTEDVALEIKTFRARQTGSHAGPHRWEGTNPPLVIGTNERNQL